MTDTRSAWGWGLASVHASGQVLDTWYPAPQLGLAAADAPREQHEAVAALKAGKPALVFEDDAPAVLAALGVEKGS